MAINKNTAKQYKVVVNTGKAEDNKFLDVAQGAGERGQTLRIKAQAGVKYQLQEIDGKKNAAPEYVKVKRVGKDLHIIFEDDTAASVIIEDYYGTMPEGYNGVIGKAENGSFYEYIPEDPQTKGLVPLLTEGAQAVNVALGGAEVQGTGAALAAFAFTPLLGALGLLGAAAAAGGGGTTITVTPTGALSPLTDSGTVGDNLTNNNSPIISGKVPTGSTASVTINGKTYPVTVNADGTYSYQIPDKLPDGTYKPVINVTQNGTTTNTDGTPFTIDTVPPAMVITADKTSLIAGQTTQVSFTLSEATTDFTVADVQASGGTLSNFTKVDSTHYTATFTPNANSTTPSLISVGSGKFSDAANNFNTDGAEANNNLSIPTNTNSNGATGYLSPSSDSGTVGDNKTNIPSPYFQGSTTPNSKVQVIIDGQTYTATADSSGNYSFKIPSNLPDGTYKPTIIVTPPGGNPSTIDGTPFTIDTTSPTIAVTADKSSLTNGQTSQISFTLSEPATDFDASDIAVSGGSLSNFTKVDATRYSATFTPATNSTTNGVISVASGKFSDAAANINTDGSDANNTVTLSVNTATTDTTKPTVQVGVDKTALTVGQTAQVTFTISELAGTSNDFSGSDVTVTGGKLSNFQQSAANPLVYTATFTPDTTTTAATGTITVASDKFVDTSNNLNTAGNTVTLNISTATNNATGYLAPTSDTGTSSADNYTADNTPDIIGNAPAGSAVSVVINGTTYTTTADANGKYSVNVPTTLPDGTYTPLITVTPAGGTSSTTNGTPFTIDTATNVAINSITGVAGPSNPLYGTAEAGDLVVIKDSAGNTLGSTVANSNGSWSFTPSNNVISGPIQAYATDKAGNSATAQTNNGNPLPSLKTALTIDPITVDNIVSTSEGAASTYTVTGKVSGAFAAGDVVKLSLNGTVYSANVAANGSYSVAVQMSDLKADSDTKIDGTVTGTGGDTATAAQDYQVESSNNAGTLTALSIDPVTADNIIGSTESIGSIAITGKVTGKYAAGDTVSLLINGKTFTGTAASDGSYSIAVPASDLIADSDTQIDGSVTGTNGTLAKAVQDYGVSSNVNPTPSAKTALTIDPIATDNVISTTEGAASTYTVTGTVSGVYAAGDVVKLTLNGVVYSATVAANGSYSTAVQMSDLKADSDTKIDGTVTGTGGDTATAAQDYQVETASNAGATTALTINVVTVDNLVSTNEAAGTVAITGKVTGKFAQGDLVTLMINGKAYTGNAAADGSYSINVAGSDLAADADTQIDGRVVGTGGTAATAIQDYGLGDTIPRDTTAPTIIVGRTNAGTTLASGANETITFKLSEASLDFSASDVAVTGGTLSNFTPVPTSGTPGTGYTDYTATFTPTAGSSGTATVGVAAGKFSDNAGNLNLDTFSASADTVASHVVESDNQVSLSFNTIPADTTPPVIAIARKGTGVLTAGGSDQITFTLSETSTTFSQADVDVVGGTLTNFAPVLSSGNATSGYTDYTATFTPSANSNGNQLARIGVQSGKFTDAANNANMDTYVSGVSGTMVEANNVIDITYNTSLPDTTAPTIIVSRAAAGMVSTSETVYFTLSEASTSFTLSDVDVSGGTLSGFAPVASSGNSTSGYTQYAATFTPTANASGLATVGVKSSTFTDAAGNQNQDTYVSPAPSGATTEANNQIALNYNTVVPDTTAPTIAISRQGTGVVTGNETITFTLSEASTNFVAADVDVVGGTLTNFAPVASSGNASTGYTSYTATFVPNANSLASASVAVASSKFTDASSNNNLDTYLANVGGATQEANNIVNFQVNTDVTAPTIIVTRANNLTTQSFTGAETINFTLSEASTDFSAADVAVTGGTLSNFTGSGTSYSALFTPTANSSGTATIGVAAGTFKEAAGNQNLDTYTGASTHVAGEVVETNNLITAPFNTDSTAPTVIVTRTSGASTAINAAESFTLTFSEAVNPASLTISDIDAVGGTITALTPVSASGSASTGYTSYIATFTPAANTSVSGSVGLKANTFMDMAGNANQDTYLGTGTENTNNIVNFTVNTTAPDTTPPTISVSRMGAGTVTGTETVYFSLSEPSTNFDATDLVATGGQISGFAPILSSGNSTIGYTQYQATFTPTANTMGTATVGVHAGKFSDAVGNLNADDFSLTGGANGNAENANNLIRFNYNTDVTPPTVLVSRSGTGTVTGPITVTFTLSESSSDFGADDIDAVGGTISNFQGSGTSYTATFTPSTNAVGTASVGVVSNKFHDGASNVNMDTYLNGVSGTTYQANGTPDANIVVFQYATDTTAPTVAISSNKTTLATGETAILTLQFSESVTDIAAGNFTLSGGAISNLVAVAGTNNTVYTATYTPAANSTANSVISIASNKFSDAAANFNVDGADANNTVTMTTNTVVPDTTPPTVLVQSSATTLSTGQTATITFTLSEASSNFVVGDVVVNGGTLGSFQQSGSNPLVYTAVFTPTANSTTPASVYVPSLSFTDAAGNNNVDGADTGVSNTNIVNMTVNTVPADTTPPTVAITSSTNTLSYGQTATLTLVFSEAVTDITAGNFTLSGGSISNLTAVAGTNNTVYTAIYTPAANSTANSVISIASNKFSDAAANFNVDGADANNTVTMTTNTVPAMALVNDTASVGEAGGVANATAGSALASTTSGVTALNVLANDTSATTVTGIASGSSAGTIGQNLVGQYGTLVMNANGGYTYTADNSNSTVQALRGSSNTLSEVFTYTASNGSATQNANLTITITGSNDAPVGVNDSANALEAGGTSNGTAGSNATGNVLTNDTDVDSGDTKAVSAITGGTLGAAKAGTYGSLTLNADGSYSYVVDNSNASVQALRTSANTLSDTFTYTVQDAAGATSTASLTVTVQGANDAPTVANTLTNQTGMVGSAITSYVVPTNTFADVDTVTNETSTLSAKLANGNALSTIGLSFDPASKTFSGTPTAAGTYTIVVTDTDAGGLTAQTTFDIVIASPILPTTTITQINGDGAPTAPPTLTITDSTTAGAAITGYAAASVTGTPSVVRYKFDFNTSVSNFALTDISFVDSATGAAIASGNVGTLQGSGSSYYVDVTMPTGSGSVAAIVKDGSYNDANNALLAGTGSSFVQAYSGTGGSYGASAVTSAGNLITPIALTLTNGNVVSYYLDKDAPNLGKFVLFGGDGQVIKSATNLTNFGVGGENYGSVFATANGGFGFLSKIGGTADQQVATYNASGDLVSGPTALSGIRYLQNGVEIPPLTTVTSDGNLAIAYSAYPGSVNATYVRKVSLTPGANFGTQLADTLIDAGSGSVGSAPCELVQLSNGKLGIVWYTVGTYFNYNYRILNSDGTIDTNFSAQTLQYPTGWTAQGNNVPPGGIKAIATSDGGMAIAFQGFFGKPGVVSEDGIFVMRVNASGVQVGVQTPIRITDGLSAATFGNPDLTQLPNGQLMVLWRDPSTNQSEYQIINSDGTLSGAITQLPLTSVTADQKMSTAIANLADGKVLAIANGQYVVLSPADGTQTITGSTTSDTQMGGAGADTLTGGGGADIILAGAGNDTVVINASNISNLTTAGKLLDGGAGIDTLRIGADTSTLDLSKSAVQANVQNFEKIDLGSDAVVNTVILNATAVQRLATQNLDGSTTNKQLIIDGTSSDLVKLSGQYDNGILAGYWQQSSTTPTRVIGGVTYKVYTISGLSGVEVLVNNAITSANTDVAYQMASGDIVTLPNTSVVIGDLETADSNGPNSSAGSSSDGSQWASTVSSTTSDVTPLVKGTLSQALSGSQVLHLYRTDVTANGSPVEIAANVASTGTLSGTNWQFQDAGLVAGHQYTYTAKIMDGSTVVDASNTYTINQASATAPDTTPPTIAISRSGSSTMTGAETITFTLSEASTDFTWDNVLQSGDIVVSGGTLGALTTSNNITYTATFTPTSNTTGTVNIGVAAGKFKDAAGNQNLDTYSSGADSVSGHVVEGDNLVNTAFNTTPPVPADTIAPTLVITDGQSAIAANSENVAFTFTFSEPVTGFTAADVTVANGTALTNTFTPVGAATVVNGTAYYSTYQMNVTTPTTGSGTVAVSVASGSYTDVAGNAGNLSAASQSYGSTINGFSQGAVQTLSPEVGQDSISAALSNGNYVWGASYGLVSNPGSLKVYSSSGAVVGAVTVPQAVSTAWSSASGGLTGAPYTGSGATDIQALPGGGFVASFRVSNGVYVATYDNSGQNLTTSGLISLSSPDGNYLNYKGYTAITVNNAGNYVLLWQAMGSQSGGGSGGFYTQEITPAFATVGSANLISLAGAQGSVGGVDIAKLSDGNLVASWNKTYVSATASTAVEARILDSHGAPIAGKSVFSPIASSNPYDLVQIKPTAGGGFIEISTNYPNANSSGSGIIQASKYAADGTSIASNVIVSSSNVPGQQNNYPRTAVLSDGTVVVTWEHSTNPAGSGSDVRFQLLDSNLNLIGSEQVVPGTNNSNLSMNGLSNQTVTELPGGGFVIGWGSGVTPYTSSVHSGQVFYSKAGTPLNLNGTSGVDNLTGGDGADMITAGGGADVIIAGGGDDQVTINSSNITQLGTSGNNMLVDGGTGTNLLKFDSSTNGVTLDLTQATVGSHLNNFQQLDITGGSAAGNTLKLNVSDVMLSSMAVGSATHVVQIKGDSSDVVNLDHLLDSGTGTGTWSTSSTTTISGTTYNVYNYSADPTLQVLIDNHIVSSNVHLT